jgi:glycosyltransferase involved in cell wall biosynthesis
MVVGTAPGSRDRTALFVLPQGAPRRGSAPVAAWTTTSGWAKGAQQVLGSAWIVSDAGVMTPEQATTNVVRPGAAARSSDRRWRRFVPEIPVTLARDIRAAARGQRASLGVAGGPWVNQDVAFVWQRLALFRRCGIELARQLHAPLVLSVHGLRLEESAAWGVSRPGWGKFTERWGELPQLHAADLVACVSESVAAAVASRGVRDDRILVTPNGVDTEHFQRVADGQQLRRELGLEGAFVVGWSGSFRGFHGLELAIEAMTRLQDSDRKLRLLLIGDGERRSELEHRVADAGLDSIIFTGAVTYQDMPTYLSACDAGLLLSPKAGPFYYSPVKIREYMACGLAVISHGLGELGELLEDGDNAIVIPPNDVSALTAAIMRLASDARLTEVIGRRGHEFAEERWTWTRPVERVLVALEMVGSRGG